MYTHTKKVGSGGRFGPRIGRRLRKEINEIEGKARNNRCPGCGGKIRRKASGIWECKSCKITFAGGAYYSVTQRK